MGKRPLVAVLAAFLAGTPIAFAQTPAGPEFRVNTHTPSSQDMVRAAMAPSGDFVVVWASHAQDGNFSGVFGQRFAASGARRGAEFQVNVHTTGHQWFPDVAVGRGGEFVVVWMSVQDESGYSVQGRRYDAAGLPLGGEFPVNTYTPGDQKWPRVGLGTDGRFVVSWASEDFDGGRYGIAARRFNATGTPLGDDFLVNTYTTGDQVFNELAVGADGSFVVVWEDFNNNRDGSFAAIFGQRYDASGNRVGGEFQVNSYTTGFQQIPSVSISPAGGFVVAFVSPQDGSGYGASARHFDASGNPVGDDFVVNTYTTGSQGNDFEGIAHDDRGNFVVTWHSDGQDGSSSGTFAQRFNASGTRRGAEFRVNTFTTGFQGWPTVVSDAVGNFVVAWNGEIQDGSFGGVFAQRFGGLRPAALAVVDGGNNVLEVPDDFGLTTSWQNVSGAPRTFQGQASEFTGPPGLIYTLGSSLANYGTVPDGATGTCSGSCITGALLGLRPAGHVDVSIRERIVPDVLGQDQRWVLHVGRSFTDVPSTNAFYRFIETLLHHGITSGCSGTQYCPVSATTRDQMAVFVLVAKEGAGYVPPACTTPLFNDVPASNPFCRWIEELARRGVVSGCGGGNYCPASAVTREEMAVFVLRTLEPALSPPPCTTPIYNDVPASSGFCRWIEELTRRAVVTGCGGGNYCPTSPVTREQMGVFISATFGLSLYGP